MTIRKVRNKKLWRVYDRHGNVKGTYRSHKAARIRVGQLEYFRRGK